MIDHKVVIAIEINYLITISIGKYIVVKRDKLISIRIKIIIDSTLVIRKNKIINRIHEIHLLRNISS